LEKREFFAFLHIFFFFTEAELSLTLEKATIEHEFSSPWRNSDVVLVVEEQKLHVHRFILEVASPVFQAICFQQTSIKERDANEIPLPGKKANEFIDLLRQLYPHLQFVKEISSKFAMAY
jgi:hypothetical protein